MNAKLVVLAAISVALIGCSSLIKYPEPASSVPTATLMLSKGANGRLGNAPVVIYTISENHQCTDNRAAARLMWATPHSQATRIASGRRVAVLSVTNYIYSTSTPYVLGDWNCQGSASFVTETGHTYEVTHVAPFHGQCTMIVTDTGTGAAPAGLVTSDVADCSAHARLKD